MKGRQQKGESRQKGRESEEECNEKGNGGRTERLADRKEG